MNTGDKVILVTGATGQQGGAVARELLGRGHKQAALNGREIDIAGDARTMPDTARILSKAAGRTIMFERVPNEEVRKARSDFAIMLEWMDRVGYSADIAANAKEFGIAPTNLEDRAARQKWS